LLQNGLWANACFVQSRLCGETVPLRPPRAVAPNPLANHYRCRDGRWFIMALFNEQRQLRDFLSAIGCAQLAEDARFATSEARRQNAGAFVEILDAVFAQRDLEQWRTILNAAGVTFGAVHSTDESSSDLQFQRIGALVPFADGNGLTVSSPFHIEGEIKVAPQRAPSVGQHNRELLAEAGYTAAEVEALKSRGIVG
jgi:formyl-CoA transferase